jgi:cupin 2 domain-containing protein
MVAQWLPERWFTEMPPVEREERYAGWRRAVAGVLVAAPRLRAGQACEPEPPIAPDASAADRRRVDDPCRRVGRVVSFGQASPTGFWYDQAEGEWVLLLAGAARLRFAEEDEARLLGPGDWLEIPPHRRHRVDWTDPATPTVWLAVFYQ